jgi:tellurite resistance protein TerC
MERFHLLKVSLAVILLLVGTKMLVADLLKRFIGPSFNYYLLAAVALILLAGVVLSLRFPKRPEVGGVPTD